VVLRRALWARGLRYRIDVAKLPGRPDIVLKRAQIVVFCDGDFWHGRDLAAREERLASGHNPGYWLSKIQGNVARDRRSDEALRSAGWTVLRYWETDILRSAETIADAIFALVQERARPRQT
jgi:DNA mismatch endonuclease (patch repair protein)